MAGRRMEQAESLVTESSTTTVTSDASRQFNYEYVESAGFSAEKESSPTDRVEKLLRKYKSRIPGEQFSQSYASVQEQYTLSIPSLHYNSQVLKELELWATLNGELHSRGYHRVEFNQEPSTTAHSSEHLVLSLPSSTTTRLTISCLLKELKQKDETIKNLRRQLTQTTSTESAGLIRVAKPICFPSKMPPPVESPESEQVIAELKSQVSRLEYENAKLRVELQNKPCLQELSTCQRKLKELELELLHSKISVSRMSTEHSELLVCQQQIKDVCSLLSVSKGGQVLRKLQSMKAILDGHSRLEKHFASLIELVYHPSNPKLASKWERPVLPRPSGHDLWCEVTWSHMIMTLQEWSYHLQGLKELEQMIVKVCMHLELAPYVCPSPPPRSSVSPNHSPEKRDWEGEEEEGVLWFSCQDMAVFMRRWLMRKANMKSVSFQMLLAMVRHFQRLFNLPSLDGVYPTMTLLSQQIEQYRNVQSHLKDLLNLGADCSTHKLVSTIEFVVLKENSHFMDKIGRHFGPKMDVDKLIEKLKLCDEFFPAFHALVLEIQLYLGVNSLSEIVPTLHKLQATT